MEDLAFDTDFDTKTGAYGPYVAFAAKGENKAYISVRPACFFIPNPKANAEPAQVLANGLMVRIRIYDNEAVNANPMPGFETAFPEKDYYKVKLFFPVEPEANGSAKLVTKVRAESGVIDDLIAALQAAVKKNRGKFLLKGESLRNVLEHYVGEIPNTTRIKVYQGISFAKPEEKPEQNKAE